MNLQMDVEWAVGYTNPSQRIRVMSEKWLAENGYCPTCGGVLLAAKPNAEVCDFECAPCSHEFELKSQRAIKPLARVCDGAYSSMMKRIAEPNNPHFFFMGYDPTFRVAQLMAVPSYLFQASAIQARKPLKPTARRAGWVGCNIILDQIPEIGKIKLVENGSVVSPDTVMKKWQKTAFLSQEKRLAVRGWTLDILKCIERLKTKDFKLDSIYAFEPELTLKYPQNRFIKDKIRQQLQVLRDRGYLEFVSPGKYKLAE